MLMLVYVVIVILMFVLIGAFVIEDKQEKEMSKPYKARAKITIRTRRKHPEILVETGREYKVLSSGLNYVTLIDEGGYISSFEFENLEDVFDFIYDEQKESRV